MSNVEQYLFRDGGFRSFAENVKTLPRDDKSVIIRSMFGSSGLGRGWHPLQVAGYNSAQVLQSMNGFVTEFDAGRIRDYSELFDNYIRP
jgi:hypothetical protein